MYVLRILMNYTPGPWEWFKDCLFCWISEHNFLGCYIASKNSSILSSFSFKANILILLIIPFLFREFKSKEPWNISAKVGVVSLACYSVVFKFSYVTKTKIKFTFCWFCVYLLGCIQFKGFLSCTVSLWYVNTCSASIKDVSYSCTRRFSVMTLCTNSCRSYLLWFSNLV